MTGGAVSKVVASNNTAFSVGDIVVGNTGWQEYARLTTARGCARSIRLSRPISTGARRSRHARDDRLYRPAQHRPAQAGRDPGRGRGQRRGRRGRRPDRETEGLPRRRHRRRRRTRCATSPKNSASMSASIIAPPDFADRLRAAVPNGIDIYFENVGGHVWEAVFPLLNKFARMPVCGLIAHYNDIEPRQGIDRLPHPHALDPQQPPHVARLHRRAISPIRPRTSCATSAAGSRPARSSTARTSCMASRRRRKR